MSKAVVIHSGGMDSTVLLYHSLSAGYEVISFGVNYGQRHAKELAFAEETSKSLGIPRVVADLRSIQSLISGSVLTGSGDVPLGHYAEESMKATVVPNRNMIMLSVALGYAINEKADCLFYGAHNGDHAIYPDCRQEFVNAMSKVARLADWHEVELNAPYSNHTKAEIVSLGHQLKVPFEQTWSCYQGLDIHCGQCGTCVERIEAFRLAGVEDPTPYANKSRIGLSTP